MPSPRNPNLWIENPINALVAQRVMEAHVRLPSGTSAAAAKEALDEEVRLYRAELASLPKAALAERIARGQQLERERVERQRFFHQPDAATDIPHWSRMSFWTIDEAVALSFGKDPRVVTWARVQYERSASPFAQSFADRREIVTRAKAAGQLYESTIPSVMLAWAHRMQIPFPAELIEAVEGLGVQIRDWKSAYDEQALLLEKVITELKDERAEHLRMMEEHAQHTNQIATGYKKIIDDRTAMAAADKALITSLQRRIAELEAARAEPSTSIAPTEKPFSTRERDSLLKLVIGMAVKGYGFNPKAGRNSATNEIVGDLEDLGMPLGEDTVRKYLAEGKDLLPPTEPE